MNKNVFCDQVVIVTGASAGIGRALVMDLARRGAKVVLAARRVDRLEQVAAECRAAGGGGAGGTHRCERRGAMPGTGSANDGCIWPIGYAGQ